MKAKKAQQQTECFCMGFGPEFSRIVSGLGSDNARNHFRNARIEALKGLRALIDHRIEALSKTRARGTTIEVE